MTEQFFVISGSDDGEPSIEVLDKEVLEERLNEDYYGTPVFPSLLSNYDDLRQLGAGQLIIIRGKQVIPQAKTIVQKWGV